MQRELWKGTPVCRVKVQTVPFYWSIANADHKVFVIVPSKYFLLRGHRDVVQYIYLNKTYARLGFDTIKNHLLNRQRA